MHKQRRERQVQEKVVEDNRSLRDYAVPLIQGCQVPFDARTINQFYNTPNIEKDEYDQFANGDIDLDEVLGFLSILGIEWKMHKGVPISFKANAMDNGYKVCAMALSDSATTSIITLPCVQFASIYHLRM
ncbi:Uncharacterized protein TCM_035661 [Theobroma cacao]|uniref:Uncharacterized protein n=1 Tax=Theobroma cacao TaxID=3641 RepID=A0A061FJE3_THECC|nr:Uncharacterized protein TCM_035661 [Theobroma cacao]